MPPTSGDEAVNEATMQQRVDKQGINQVDNHSHGRPQPCIRKLLSTLGQPYEGMHSESMARGNEGE